MAYDHIYLVEARAEVEEALKYYDHINAELSEDLLDKIESAISLVTHNPLLFQQIKRGYRKANLDRFPYQIIYRIQDQTIVIIAFAHHKQKPSYWRKRKL
ncbi:MAG: type II toxin-antitoxin system RelE/ParE family toxin [Bacteroidetes bacterium]|nr:type II toxin-antitoxin system RelE/ParE family toxin [Bacteroidota bacterium]